MVQELQIGGTCIALRQQRSASTQESVMNEADKVEAEEIVELTGDETKAVIGGAAAHAQRAEPAHVVPAHQGPGGAQQERGKMPDAHVVKAVKV
jgi:hypothetical protein